MSDIGDLQWIWDNQRKRLANGEELEANELIHGSGCPCPMCTDSMALWKRHRAWMEKAEKEFYESEAKRKT